MKRDGDNVGDSHILANLSTPRCSRWPFRPGNLGGPETKKEVKKKTEIACGRHDYRKRENEREERENEMACGLIGGIVGR